MSWLLFAVLALVLIGLAVLWAGPVTPTAEKLAMVNWLLQGPGTVAGGPLLDVTHRLSNANIVPSAATTLAQLTECIYTGYMPYQGLDGSAAYKGTDGAIHTTFPAVPFIATQGAFQTVSNIALGPITVAGNLSVVVTAAGMTGSPITLAVPVLTTDSNNDIAQKIAIVARATANIAAFFNVTVDDNNVKFQAINAAANDATMNVSFATGTATGLTAKPTATQLRAGVAVATAFVPDTAYIQFATDPTGTILLFAQQLTTPISFSAPGAGGDLSLDYVYGA